jgi:hypothetical protein
MELLIFMRAVLDATIGMMNQGLPCLAFSERRPEGLSDMPGVERVMDVMTDDTSGPGIGDQTDIDMLPLSLRGQVGNVGHPHLFAAVRSVLLRPVLEQIGMTAQAMMTVGGLVIRASRYNEQTRVTQEIEERIAPDLYATLTQGLAQHVLQLAGAYTRLAAAYGHDRFEDVPIAIGHGMFARETLVVRLSAHAPVLASLAHAQACDEALREDLPKGFFTIRTP